MKRIVTIIFCTVLCVFGQEQPSVPEDISPETKETLDGILDFMACVDEGKCDPRQQNVNPEALKAAKRVRVAIPEVKPKHLVFVESADDLQREVPNENFPIPGKPSNPVFVENINLHKVAPNVHIVRPGKPSNPVFVENADDLQKVAPNVQIVRPGKPSNAVFVENADDLHKVAPNVQIVRPGKPRYPVFDENAQDSNLKDPNEHLVTPGKPSYPVQSPYFSLCEKLLLKMSELEHGHEELKSLKYQFLERLNYYASSVSTECQKGESIVIKILDLIIYVAEKMKREYGHITHDKYIPIEEPYDHLDPGYVGSYRGIPGVHYPNYTEVPITSFSCSGRRIPGFYVDLETRCQVFHVCYEHRRESFLCPLGTIFNQALLVCDYWYSSTCSDEIHVDLDTDYNQETSVDDSHTISEETESSVDTDSFAGGSEDSEEELKKIVPFLPVRAKIIEFPKGLKGKPIVSSIDDIKEVANKILGGIVQSSKSLVSTTVEAIDKFPKSKTSTKTAELPKPQVTRVHSKVEKPESRVVGVLPGESKAKSLVSPINGVEDFASKILDGIVTSGKRIVSSTVEAVESFPKSEARIKSVGTSEPRVPHIHSKVRKPSEPQVVKVLPRESKVEHLVSSIDGVEGVADKIFSGIVTAGTKVASKTRKAIELLPEPKVLPKVVKLPVPRVVPVLPKVMKLPEPQVVPNLSKVKLPKPQVVPVSQKIVQPVPKPIKVQSFPKMKPLPLAKVKSLKSNVIPWIKMKMVATSVLPTTKAQKVAAVPFAKAMLASTKIPMKAKIIAAPIAKAKFTKASVPFYKAKAIPAAAAKPVAKTKLIKSKLAAAVVPVVKVKKTVKAVLPISKVAAVKSKLVVPSVKAKLVKSIVLSPLTKKALAMGYLKLLKAKKLGLLF